MELKKGRKSGGEKEGGGVCDATYLYVEFYVYIFALWLKFKGRRKEGEGKTVRVFPSLHPCIS